jgi:hypothetical protein
MDITKDMTESILNYPWLVFRVMCGNERHGCVVKVVQMKVIRYIC